MWKTNVVCQDLLAGFAFRNQGLDEMNLSPAEDITYID